MGMACQSQRARAWAEQAADAGWAEQGGKEGVRVGPRSWTAGPPGLVWFFLFSGFSFPFLFQTHSKLFEFKHKFEFKP